MILPWKTCSQIVKSFNYIIHLADTLKSREHTPVENASLESQPLLKKTIETITEM